MKLLVIDNYDSFTYNLVYILRQHKLVNKLEVLRNDKVSKTALASADKILLSPGPGIPKEAGDMLDIIREYSEQKPILGICLGHQGIGEIFGATLENMQTVLHGYQDDVAISEDYLFRGLPKVIKSGHYHSWRIEKGSVNGQLEIIAQDQSGAVMAIRHKELDVRGLQFHPESILTPRGTDIINNWIEH